MKEGSRILALDDSPFSKQDKKVRVMGIIGRRDFVEGAISYFVTKDGNDATAKTIQAIRQSRFHNQIKLVALQSLLFAGLNLVDITMLKKELGIEAMAITRRKPSKARLLMAMKAAKIAGIYERRAILESIEKNTIELKANGFYVIATKGLAKAEIRLLLPYCITLLRLAHITAQAVERGESKGRL